MKTLITFINEKLKVTPDKYKTGFQSDPRTEELVRAIFQVLECIDDDTDDPLDSLPEVIKYVSKYGIYSYISECIAWSIINDGNLDLNICPMDNEADILDFIKENDDELTEALLAYAEEHM